MEHTQDVKCVAWHPREEVYILAHISHNLTNFQLLASASYDDNIILYVDDPQDDWFAFTTLSGHTSTVWSVAFSPCGSLLASVSDDRTMRIWQRYPKPPVVGANQLVRIGQGSTATEGQWKAAYVIPDAHERSIYSVAWCKTPPEGNSAGLPDDDRGWIASTGGDGHIKVWHIKVGIWIVDRFSFSLYVGGWRSQCQPQLNSGCGRRTRFCRRKLRLLVPTRTRATSECR